jgi:hypothetical protein
MAADPLSTEAATRAAPAEMLKNFFKRIGSPFESLIDKMIVYLPD